MTHREILIAARALIASPDAWQNDRRITAVGVGGGQCDPTSPAAVKRCGYGAIIAACAADENPNETLAVCGSMLDHAAPAKGFPAWESTATHEQMLVVFDRAIESEPCGGCSYCRPRRVA